MTNNSLLNVAFSGTGFLFPVHIGALQAIEDSGTPILGYSGTSGGAIVAAAAACGVSGQELLEIAEKMHF